MAPVGVLVLGSVKALLLLAMAAAGAALLQRKPARLRVVVWATALAGTLLIPMVTPVLPRLELPVLPPATTEPLPDPRAGLATVAGAIANQPLAHPASLPGPTVLTTPGPRWPTLMLLGWAAGAGIALSRLGVAVWRTQRLIRRATPVSDGDWLHDLAWTRRRVGLRRTVRIVVSREIEIPATIGVVRPTVIVPDAAGSWPRERREAVLLHELVHVYRLDWPLRLVARLARGCYWFNPLAWWAVRRLDLEQELACDEEVVALGTRPSTYACHLLGIARAVARHPAPAISGLEMARASHLEERIMSILETTTPRRISRRVLAPATILIAALVPALAAVVPTDTPASAPKPELKQVLEEMGAAEARLEPQLAKIEAVKAEMAPALEKISSIEVAIDDEAMAAIEAELQPYLERLESIELDMAPMESEMEAIAQRIEELDLRIDDGTLAEIERQIHEQLEPLQDELERLHESMAPQLEQIEAIHLEMEPMHRQLEAAHVQLEPQHEELEKIHATMEPFHEQMEMIHREMEPIHEEMERLGQRLEEALGVEVAAVLRERLASVTGPQAPFDEAATRILEDAHIHVNGDVVRVSASPTEAREILSDLLGPHRTGSQESFDAAVTAAANAVADLEITAR
jgi:beta-lactamase regulating signal transducer with metallopeptidase domain/predicted  nucleic acid-binding Zn-ribbon protein